MSDEKKSPNVGWWAGQLDEIDEEIARLCTICKVRILDPGVIARVIKNDASVCGSPNKIAFKKLHDAMRIHYAVREKSSEYVGEKETMQSLEAIVDRLRKKYGDSLGKLE
ncbi:MAG: hypothetical protein WCE38_02620 [Burkholderiales bacterium]